jgi:hypothetical protein
MSFQRTARFVFPCLLTIAALAAGADTGKAVTVKGYVLDSACAFTKDLKKPISSQCAMACAKAGSPLVILTGNGMIYWPIADTHAFIRPERKAVAICRAESYCQRQGLSAWRFERIGHRKDRAPVRCEVNSLASGFRCEAESVRLSAHQTILIHEHC